jgi:hypothetical protein
VTTPVEPDPDEDLFAFDQIASAFPDDADEDLAELFASFGAEEDEVLIGLEQPAVEAPPAPLPRATSPVAARGPVHTPAPPRELPPAPLPRRRERARPAEEAEPESEREARGSLRRLGLSKSVLLLLLAITCMNGLVAVVAMKSTGEMRESVLDVGRHVARTADEMREGAFGQARELQSIRTPTTQPDPESHPTFDVAVRLIEEGRFAEARQRLYSLLAIVDRLDSLDRDRIEARASYLLARALHLEALTRAEVLQ